MVQECKTRDRGLCGPVSPAGPLANLISNQKSGRPVFPLPKTAAAVVSAVPLCRTQKVPADVLA